MGIFVDHSNKPFGNLTALYRASNSRWGTRWHCKCVCGTEKDILTTHLVRGRIKACGTCRFNSGSNHSRWTGYGKISGEFWDNILRGARGLKGRKHSVPMTISIKQAWELFVKQDGKCALSGIVLEMSSVRSLHTASLDRIDSSKGYVKGNIQWVHKDINMMKRTYSQQHFVNMCKLVASNLQNQ